MAGIGVFPLADEQAVSAKAKGVKGMSAASFVINIGFGLGLALGAVALLVL